MRSLHPLCKGRDQEIVFRKVEGSLGVETEYQFTKLCLSLKRKFIRNLLKEMCTHSSNGRDKGLL